MTELANPYRLPRSVVPIRYELTLEPDLAGAAFAGESTARIEVVEEVDAIVLNAIELEISSAWVSGGDGANGANRVEVTSIDLDEATERARLALPSALAPGTYDLHTVFRGVLNDKLKGFYRSTFTDTDGNEQIIATTQMEATDARRAFPCWDEPDLKAVFAVTLVVDDDLTALSNAREIGREPREGGKVAVRFADTMKMSTYLVAFIVGPLDVTAPVDVDGKHLRVAYPRGKGHLTDFALEVGRFTLDYFREYYGIVYPGDKLDLVAIPDFAFGAMENLGCVTFREVLLLVDPEQVTQPELQNVTDVIAHELAHMWFGDLVTMKWWNGIWLNEAFATFMEMLATDAFRPEWDRWTSFGLSRTAAFDVDSLQTTRPIEFEVVSPDDAEGMFDILTYEKGAAVVRMLEQYLGADEFRDGIRHYLAIHQYGNTETTDLWDALEESSGEPVRSIMDSWIFQGGYPVIDVELIRDDLRSGEGTGAGGILRLTQRRYGYAGDLGDGEQPSTRGTTYQIPLIFSMKQRPDVDADGYIIFEKTLLDQEGVSIPLIEPVDWVLINTEGTGFYRASYSTELLDALASHAQADLSPIERYGLIDDAWAAVLAGATSVPDFFRFVQRFADETDLSVWQRIIGSLNFLDRLVEGADRARFQGEVRRLLGPVSERLGSEPGETDSDRDRELRGSVFEAMGVLGADGKAKEAAAKLLALETASPGTVDPSMFAGAIAISAPALTPEGYDDFVQRFKTAATPQEEVRYLYALADAEDPDLVRRTLDLSLTDDVRTQNAPYLIRRALTNRAHGLRAWKFVVDQWDAVNERFPSNSIVRMLEGVRSLHEPSVAQTVFAFFETHEVPQGDKILAQHLERLEVNVTLRHREAAAFAASLR
ncbi:MAG: M1 family metallopeptidase [Actinobacteria bacterium]|nr:M1 family metallopeptidase [Actinomycetota bacterium]